MKKISLIFLHICFFLFCFTEISAQQLGKPFFENYSATEYKAHNRNFGVVCDTTCSMFVANFEGLLVFDGVAWQTFHTPGISRITTVYRDTSGVIWAGGNNVLGYVIDDNSYNIKWIVNDADDNDRFGEIITMYEKGGNLFFNSKTTNDVTETYLVTDKGIKKMPVIETPTVVLANIGNYNVTCKEEIKDLKLYAYGTDNHGVVIFDENNREVYNLSKDDGLCSNAINDLAYDGKGTLWGATDNGLFSMSVSLIYSHYNEANGLSGQVTCIQYYNGTLFVGTLQGLFMLENNGRFTQISGIDLACWQLLSTPKGLVAATAEGLFLYNGKLNTLTNRHTLCVIQDTDNTLITGELDGVFRYTIGGGDKQLIKIHNVSKLIKDKEGGVWAVTLYQEIYYMAPGKQEFSPGSNKKISLMFEYTDDQGRLWKTGRNNMGIECEKLSDHQKQWISPLSGYIIQAMAVKDEMVWVGGNFGVIQVDLNTANKTKPYNSKLYVFNIIQKDDDVSFTICIDKKDALGKTLYSYRLKDGDEWSKWSEDQSIEFTNLAPGSYVLKGRAKDTFGNIVESDSYAFSIPTPFYRTWWAILIYILLATVLVWMGIRWRMRIMEEEQQRLEAIVEDRTKELKQAQGQLIRQEREATVGKLTKGLIDRILNPMNYINNFSHLTTGLIKDLKEDIEDEKDQMSEDNYEDSMDVLDMMKTNLEKIEQHGMSTTRILKAMEELLKERNGKVEIVDIAHLCQKNIEVFNKYYEKEIAALGVKVEWSRPNDPIVADVVSEQLNKVISAMLSNCMYAVKKKAEKLEGDKNYQPAIRLSISPKSGTMPPHIIFYDNGIGIEDGILDKIFDPFFTTKPTAEASGVGLYLCQQIIQDMNGTISVRSVKDEYTEFTITLP